FLRENDLETAAREFNQLKGWPKNIAKDWIASARTHLEVKQALEVIEYQAQLASLNMA
ncbi:MICOS complex subunit mic60, partial [Basidiobolus ranarum]